MTSSAAMSHTPAFGPSRLHEWPMLPSRNAPSYCSPGPQPPLTGLSGISKLLNLIRTGSAEPDFPVVIRSVTVSILGTGGLLPVVGVLAGRVVGRVDDVDDLRDLLLDRLGDAFLQRRGRGGAPVAPAAHLEDDGVPRDVDDLDE